jgi:hypothetical protein
VLDVTVFVDPVGRHPDPVFEELIWPVAGARVALRQRPFEHRLPCEAAFEHHRVDWALGIQLGIPLEDHSLRDVREMDALLPIVAGVRHHDLRVRSCE